MICGTASGRAYQRNGRGEPSAARLPL